MLTRVRTPGVRTYLLCATAAVAVTSVVATAVLMNGLVDAELAGIAGDAAQHLDRRLQQRMDELLVVAVSAAGLLSLLMALAFAVWIARPLERLTESARRIGAGQLDERAGVVGGGREMAELAGTMDGLATALRQHEELRRATAADVTHELRNALVGLVARTEGLHGTAADAAQPVLAGMAEDAARLHRLIDDVHLLVDAQRPALLVQRRPLDVGDLVRAAAERYEGRCRALSIGLRISTEPLSVRGDPGRLAQVVDNLLSNAVRYTDPGGRIEVRVARRGAAAAITVADSGIGIAPEHAARVFDRFWRAVPAAARVPQGSGVGLAVVSEIVRAHGGRVDLATRPGHGSAFTVLLAASPPAPVQAARAPRPAALTPEPAPSALA